MRPHPRRAFILAQVLFTTHRPVLRLSGTWLQGVTALFSSSFPVEERPDSGFRKLQQGGAAPAPVHGAWMHPIPAVGFGEQRSQPDPSRCHRSPQGTALLLPTSYLNPRERLFSQRKPKRTAGDKQTGELPAVPMAPREEICLTLEKGPEGVGSC